MNIYINGIGMVSPQNSFNNDDFVENIGNFLKCKEPNYKEYINPILLRRMSRIIKMGVYSAITCLKDANIENPDAIITGTAMGCIEDTEKFLISMIDNDEELLTPTSFIQSTHNTVSSQIALLIKCNSYNFTYTHRGFSFESSLLDASILIIEKQANNVLLGGIDELTDNHFNITKKNNWWKDEFISNFDLIDSITSGSIAGEGSAFLIIDNIKTENSYAKFIGLKTFLSPLNNNEFELMIQNFINSFNIKIQDIDNIIVGKSGDYDSDFEYNKFINLFPYANVISYKNLCGEYYTSSSFATCLASHCIKNQTIPEKVLIKRNNKNNINYILIYNHFQNFNHSLILLSNV